MTRKLGTYHPTFGYHFVPGLKARVEHEGGGYLVRANELGFRSEREFEPSKPSDVFRVLLFGDSFAAGMGVSNRDRFGDLLEQNVPGLEVFNFAVPGSGPDTQYLIYRELGSQIEHDLVLIAVWVQNIRRIVARYRSERLGDGEVRWVPKPYFQLGADGELSLHNCPVPRDVVSTGDLSAQDRQVQTRLVDRSAGARLPPRVKSVAQRVIRYDALPVYRDPRHPDWLLMKAILDRWTRELTAPAVVMPIPMHWHLEGMSSPKHYRRRFNELADPPARVIHDPFPDLMKYSTSERRAFRFDVDTHPTRSYHRALAHSLEKPIRQRMAARRLP